MRDKIRAAPPLPAIPAEKFGSQSPSAEIGAHCFLLHDLARSVRPPRRAFFGEFQTLPAPEQTAPFGNFPAGANPPIPASRCLCRPPDSPAAPPSIPIFPDPECLDGIVHPAPLVLAPA